MNPPAGAGASASLHVPLLGMGQAQRAQLNSDAAPSMELLQGRRKMEGAEQRTEAAPICRAIGAEAADPERQQERAAWLRWPEGREGALGLGGAAADSLTSGNRNPFPGLTLPAPNHPSPPAQWGAPCSTPSLQHPTAQDTGLPMGRSHGWALLTPAQELFHHPADAQPGWQGAGASVSWDPKDHLCPGAPWMVG